MEPLTLTELGRRVAARWVTLAVVAGIGLAAGVAFHQLSATRFEAESVIRVDAADPGLVDMEAEIALASSRQVSAEALDALADEQLSIDELERAVTAASVARSRVLRISYVADSPVAAARGADAVAHAYLAVREIDVERRLAAEKIAASTSDLIDPARLPRTPVGLGLTSTAAAGLVLGMLVAIPVAARPSRRTAEPVPPSVE
ncbi:hypothetical protein [Aeromicrobium sp. UC242_57]|uniref:hypothetical protein n=1 Tax=Aeromicrobium sp. UC242_57 TaxID=3374624 RepID=UPI0037BDDD4B